MNTKGLVEPARVTTAQRNALVMGAADTGVIFNTSSTQYEGWNGTAWVPLNTPTTITRIATQGTMPNGASGNALFTTLGITEPPGLNLFAAHLMVEAGAVGSDIWRPQPYENTTVNSCIWLLQLGVNPRFQFFVIGTNVRNRAFRAILHYA